MSQCYQFVSHKDNSKQGSRIEYGATQFARNVHRVCDYGSALGLFGAVEGQAKMPIALDQSRPKAIRRQASFRNIEWVAVDVARRFAEHASTVSIGPDNGSPDVRMVRRSPAGVDGVQVVGCGSGMTTAVPAAKSMGFDVSDQRLPLGKGANMCQVSGVAIAVERKAWRHV